MLKLITYYSNLRDKLKQSVRECSPDFIYDVKNGGIMNQHKLNFYRDALLQDRGYIESHNFYSLKEELLDDSPFCMDIDNFVGMEGHHGKSSNNPLTRTAMQLLENNNLDVAESAIYKYQQSFQPKTYGDVYNLKSSNNFHLLPQMASFYPWLDAKPKNDKSPGIFGPKHITSTETRLIRIKNLIHNIKEFGYIPSQEDIIEGYVLV